MNTYILVLLLIGMVYTESLGKEIDTILFPNRVNELRPFQINGIEGSESKIDLKLNCSDGIQKTGIYYKKKNLCNYDLNGKTADEINPILTNLAIKLNKKTRLSQNESIVYSFRISFEGEKPVQGRVVQRFSVTKKIPITLLTDKIHISRKKNKIRTKVLTIGDGYVKTIDKEAITLKGDELPKWLKYKVKGNTLTIYGDIPKSYPKSNDFSIHLVDSVNNISSDIVRLQILNEVGSNIKNRWIILFFVVFVIIGIILLTCVLFHVFFSKLDQTMMMPNDIPESEIRALKESEIVLSESILNWKQNQTMSEMKSTQNFEDGASYSEDHSFQISDRSCIRSSIDIRVDEQSLMLEIAEFSNSIEEKRN